MVRRGDRRGYNRLEKKKQLEEKIREAVIRENGYTRGKGLREEGFERLPSTVGERMSLGVPANAPVAALNVMPKRREE